METTKKHTTLREMYNLSNRRSQIVNNNKNYVAENAYGGKSLDNSRKGMMILRTSTNPSVTRFDNNNSRNRK